MYSVSKLLSLLLLLRHYFHASPCLHLFCSSSWWAQVMLRAACQRFPNRHQWCSQVLQIPKVWFWKPYGLPMFPRSARRGGLGSLNLRNKYVYDRQSRCCLHQHMLLGPWYPWFAKGAEWVFRKNETKIAEIASSHALGLGPRCQNPWQRTRQKARVDTAWAPMVKSTMIWQGTLTSFCGVLVLLWIPPPFRQT